MNPNQNGNDFLNLRVIINLTKRTEHHINERDWDIIKYIFCKNFRSGLSGKKKKEKSKKEGKRKIKVIIGRRKVKKKEKRKKNGKGKDKEKEMKQENWIVKSVKGMKRMGQS